MKQIALHYTAKLMTLFDDLETMFFFLEAEIINMLFRSWEFRRRHSHHTRLLYGFL